MHPVLIRSLISGTAASVVTTGVLAALARLEGAHPAQPANATSHWYWGDEAGRSRGLNVEHTLLGLFTHHAASLLWAGVFEAARRFYPGRTGLGDAFAVSALAAAVDYGLVPKRLTPGWEQVVSPRAIGLTYVAMALTLAAVCRLEDRR